MAGTTDNITGVASARKNYLMNTNPIAAQVNPVALNGFEAFLETHHPEVVEPVQAQVEVVLEKTTTYYETRTLLELLGQVQKVHELLGETNKRLTSAYARVQHMERVVEDQEKKLDVIPALEKQAQRAIELQDKLDKAIAELEKLRQPWWHRLSNNGAHKI
jgi:hypothetical protein